MTADPVPDPILFDCNGPFYEMIIAFSVAISSAEIYLPANPLQLHKGQPGLALEGKVHTQFVLDTFDLWTRHQTGAVSADKAIASMCCMLMNTAYEAVKEKNDKSPLFEFFRHVRNAASHRNTFYFLNWEPARPASWRGIVIDHNARGTTNPLFGTRCFFDVLGTADPILLLWDIEQLMTKK